ncbi:hypothetical protein EDD22DRAFT_961925 [Suillus occidentalis]|nr:hypothetical protein EDD22DRAFT_961925 [Suillus occidentalis]
MSQAEENLQSGASSQASQPASASSATTVPTSDNARHRRKIADLEEKLQVLESGQAVKKREIDYIMSQGRAIRRIVTLFDSIEDLIGENDRRCDREDDDHDMTIDQDRLQTGYIVLNNVLPWFHQKASNMEHDDYTHMLKKLRQGADGARGDDTSKLKSLVPDWVNRELKPNPPVDPEDKFCRGFTNNACGKLLCPTELDWNDPTVRAGIRDRADGFVVTEMSWPAFLYAGYTADQNNLEEGLFKSTLLVQAFKAIFTSPSSAKETHEEGFFWQESQNSCGTNHQDAKSLSSLNRIRILSIALHTVVSDLMAFWYIIVDFFERPPGRVARRNVDRLLAWWTRKVFGTSQRAELSDTAKAKMSVNALTLQRARLDDAQFDSE